LWQFVDPILQFLLFLFFGLCASLKSLNARHAVSPKLRRSEANWGLAFVNFLNRLLQVVIVLLSQLSHPVFTV